MQGINELKTLETPPAPLLLFECRLRSGDVERWSTHRLSFDGEEYIPAVLRHNVFELQAGSEDGVDGISRISITLNNCDSRFSQIERAQGWKGAKLSVSLGFFDLDTGAPASERRVMFQGTGNPPDEITEGSIRLTFSNRLSLQRLSLPQLRIQRRCPWTFPTNARERAEAAAGAANGKYSRFFACGYAPDVPAGCGNLGAAQQPFASCGYTRTECVARGMFDRDSSLRVTRRFGGIEFVPSTIQVRTSGDSTLHSSAVLQNEAKYNDVVPLVYGTAWLEPPVVLARNDGNLTHLEALLGSGEVTAVHKVIVNGIEIPKAVAGTNMTATGWFSIVTTGGREGTFNSHFTDTAGQPAGDPYGSMAMVSIAVPNRINDGRAVPRVQVLMDGMKLPVFNDTGDRQPEEFTNNPVWVLLDVLLRSGWILDEIDVASFARAATYCSAPITTTDLAGNVRTTPRYQCNLVIRKRRSAAEIVRGIRRNAPLCLSYNEDALLGIDIEGSLAKQHPAKPAYSNAAEALNGGWPAYEFGDGSLGFGDIVRRENGEPAIRFWSRSTADTPNRFTVEFQDEFNEYQQDGLSVVDYDDAACTGQEINGGLVAVGIPNFNQAGRVIRRQLDRTIRGNTYVQFESGLRAIGIRPGDIVTLTYLKEGFERQPFRVLKIAPGQNYETSVITAQIHDDSWYSDEPVPSALIPAGRRESPFGADVPRPLAGPMVNADGTSDFNITEKASANADGSHSIGLDVEFMVPAQPAVNGPAAPLVSLAAEVSATGGILKGGSTHYYAASGFNAEGEGCLSFIIRADIPDGANTASVRLKELHFGGGSSAFNVYRGVNPAQLYRIAEAVPIASEYVDAGASASAGSPPDANYHHANFYWRLEHVPACTAEIVTPTTIGNSTLALTPNEFRGKLLRIHSGKGSGQERTVLSNSATTFTVATGWTIPPDSTSEFSVSDAGWQFGALAHSSPATIEVPNREGAVVQVSGRAASVHDKESPAELSPLTRWKIGGAGRDGADADVPGVPYFGLSAPGRGVLEVRAIAFETLQNTQSIRAATMTVHYVDESQADSSTTLAQELDPAGTDLAVAGANLSEGAVLVIGGEVLRIISVDATDRYGVERGLCGTQPEQYASGTVIYPLKAKTVILPFVAGFFGTPASGGYSYQIPLPNARVVAAEMVVTNSVGNSQTAKFAFTDNTDFGLRTLSGGQIALQVDGFLAIQTRAVPPFTVDAPHSVRDVFASVGVAPSGGPVQVRVTQNGEPYCELEIPAGERISNIVPGRTLAALREHDELGLDITSVSQTADSTPGSDLTVTVRL
jgi:hypothetical protein